MRVLNPSEKPFDRLLRLFKNLAKPYLKHLKLLRRRGFLSGFGHFFGTDCNISNEWPGLEL